jgi:hypothetical protein
LANWSQPNVNAAVDTQSFDVGAGTYFAHIAGTASSASGLNLGLYSLLVTFQPVPLPASEWMLLIGILVVLGLTRVLGAYNPLESRPLRAA